MLWYVHSALVAYEHKSEARNLRHHITLFLIFFFVSSEGGSAINELILGFKNSFIGNNYKLVSALSIWILCHEVLFTTEKLKKKFCSYFEKGWTKHVLEIPNQFRLGLGLCYECIYYDVYLRRRKFKNFHHEDYHYKYMILSNPIEFAGHFVSVMTLVMISMTISCFIAPYLADKYIKGEKSSLSSVISRFSADTWFYIKLCLVASTILVISQDFLVVTNAISIGDLSIPIIYILQIITILFFMFYPIVVNDLGYFHSKQSNTTTQQIIKKKQ